MANEFIDLKGFLFLVLIIIPQTLSTNIDCGGKPFHCLNTTHFMICVDLGGGVSSTIDDFIIPCPPTTVCEKNNRFECEFPKVGAATTDLNVIAVSNVNDKSVDAKTIPPDKWTTALPSPEKISVTELPMKEKSMSSLNSDILEHLKDEFTGGNEKVFDEDIAPSPSLLDVKNSTVGISFGTPIIEQNITTTDKYSHPKIKADISTNGALSATQTISILKENISYIQEPIAIKNNNTGDKFNITKEINQLYSNNTEILEHLKDEFTGGNKKFLDEDIIPLSSLVSFKNSTAETSFVTSRVEKIITTTEKYSNINADTSTIGSLTAFQKVSTLKENITYIEKPKAIKNNDTGNKFNTTKPINLAVAITSNYNDPDFVDHVTATKSNIYNSITSKTITIDTNYNVEQTTDKMKRGEEYSHTLQQVTAKPIEITTMNLNSPNTSKKDLSKLEETAPSPDGLTIITNEHNNITKKHNKTKVTDQKLNFNVSDNQELLKKTYDSAPIIANVTKMTVDTLNTTESGLVTTTKYNDQSNIDNVIASEAVLKDLLPVKVNSTVSNYIVTSVSEVLKKDDKHKDLLKSVTTSSTPYSTIYSSLNYDLGTTNTDIIFTEVPLVTNINMTSNFSDIHETLENHITANLSTNSVTELVLGSVVRNESSGFTFEITTPYTLVNDDSIVGFKVNIEMKSKENASTFNDAKIKVGTNKTKVINFPTETFNTDEIINHKIKPTTNLTNNQISKIASTFRITSMNNSQTSATESPVKITAEQLLSIEENYINNLNSFVTPTLEKPKTMALPLVNHLTTYGKKSMGIQSNTTVDFIKKQSNFMITKYNVSIDMKAQSSSTLPTILSINIDGTNEVSQNTTPVLQLEAVTYSDDKGGHQDTLIENGSENFSVTTEINKALLKIENSDTIYKKSGIEGNYSRDTDANPLLIAVKSNNVNVELADKFMNITEQKKILLTENASMTPNEMGTESSIKENNTVMKSMIISSNISNNENNEVNTKNRSIPTLATMRNNINHFENFTFNLKKATSEQVSNLSIIHKVNGTLLTEKMSNVTMKLLETTATSPALDRTTQHSLITESVTESIYPTNLSTGTSSSNDIVGNTQSVMEYQNDEISLNDTEGNIIASSSDIYPGLLISTANSFTETNIHKTNESSRAPTVLIIDTNQDRHLSPNNKTKISNNITIGSVKNFIELETGYDRSKLLTSNATMEKLSIITVNHILPNKTVEMIPNNTNILHNVQIMRSDVPQSTQETIAYGLDSLSTSPTPVAVTVKKQPNIRFLSSTGVTNSQYNKDEVINVEKQIMNSNISNITEQVATNNFETISTLVTPIEATVEEQKNILVNPILRSTMGSIIQPNMYELAKIKTMVSTAKKEPNITVNPILLSTLTSISQPTTEDLAKVEELNITQRPPPKVSTDDNISMLSTSNEFIFKNQSNISSSTVPLISKSNTEESGKNKTVMEGYNMAQSPRQVVVIDLDSLRIPPSLNESTAKKDLTVKLISPSTIVTPQNELGSLELPIGNLNISRSTPQTLSNDLDSKAMLLTTNEFMAKESNIAENQIVPSIITSIRQLNTHELDKFQIQVESSNMTQTTQETVDSNLHNTSMLLMSMESIVKQQSNITANPIVTNTMAPISQNNTDKVVELGAQIVNSNVTQYTQQIMDYDFNKTSFNIVTEPTTIVETINDTHNIAGRPILSDIIFGEIMFANGTTNLKSPNQLHSGIPKKITERATLSEKLQTTALLRNTSSDLNKREDLNFDGVNGTFIDKQLNIELPGSLHDNETSAENYDISTVYNKFVSQKYVPSPSTPINKSENNVGYNGPRSAMDMELTQNITLLNKIKYIYNSTNNSESVFGKNKERKSIINGTDAKVKNSTAYNIFSKQQIKQPNTSAESHMSNMNISYSLTNHITNNSSLTTVVRLTNAKNPPKPIDANTTALPVDCLKLPRGKYADSKDCRKFYICVGKLQPVVGTCPNNTVFSEINKQCTKNLSQCVRNHQFHCLYEGRFSDFLRDNIYYICIKNNMHGFLRYKLQCQNGYHLNKAKVKCEENEIWNQSDTSVSNSGNVGGDLNVTSVSSSDVSESSGNIELECKKEGKFPYPKDCRKYYVCTKNSKDEYRRKIKSCSTEEIYDRIKKKCVSSDSEED